MKKKFKFRNIIIILVIIYLGYIFVTQQFTMNRLSLQVKGKETELQKTKDKNQSLQDEVKISKTDKYVEKLAREKLGFVKQGETPVINKSK